MRAFVLFSLCLTACAPEPPRVNLPPPRPELVFEGLTLKVYRKGVPQLLVRSPRVQMMKMNGDLAAERARFDFYVDALTLDAPTLNGNLESLAFDATGGVTLGSAEFTATTAAAHFEGKDGARGVASGTSPVAVRGAQAGRPFSLDAHAFRFDVDNQHAVFDTVTSRVGAP